MLPSLAIFNPQSKELPAAYLDALRLYAIEKEELRPLLRAIETFPDIWSSFIEQNAAIAQLEQSTKNVNELSNWIRHGDSSRVSGIASGVVSLPLLVLVQISQYFQFLELQSVSHNDFLCSIQDRGGIHGYCGGMLAAIAIACAANEAEVTSNASMALKFALLTGAYSELGNDKEVGEPSSIVVRLKYEGQGEHILRDYKDAYISAVTDPKTISIVGSAKSLQDIQSRLRHQGMQTQTMHIDGKVHNPGNADLADQQYVLCKKLNITLPDASKLKASLRSNRTGEILKTGTLTREVIETILVACCQWYRLLCGVSQDLKKTGHQSHILASFGIGSCVSLTAFHQADLVINRVDVLPSVNHLMSSASIDQTSDRHANPINDFPNAVAVIGMACRFPDANNIEEFWDLICSVKSTLQEVPPERIDFSRNFRASQDKWAHKKAWWGNFIKDIDGFDNHFFGISSREAASMDPQHRVMLETAYQAMESSGYLGRCDDDDPVGVFLGSSLVDYLENTSSHPSTAHTVIGTLRAFLSGRISNYFRWSGPSETLDTACSSSLVAINRACKAIQSNECSIALAGGINLMTSATSYFDLGKAGFLSSTGQCKPFDKDADGYCRSEGAGLVVLKSLTRAIADGDHIFGSIVAVGTNYGGFIVPNSPSQIRLYQSILKQAEVKAEQVSYIETHGTGTQAGDPVEISSLQEVFGERQALSDSPLYIGSVKGNIGHCESAAGIAGLIKALLMVYKGYIPPLASHTSLNPKIIANGIVIPSKMTKWPRSRRLALVNSYGAAGSNAAALLCQPPQGVGNYPLALDTVARHYPIIISARSVFSLSAIATNLLKFVESKASEISLAHLAYSLAEKRPKHGLRWISSQQSVDGLIRGLRSDFRPTEVQQSKKIVLAFSGQSRTAIGSQAGLYASCRLFRKYVNVCDDLLVQLGYSSVLTAISTHVEPPTSDLVQLHCALFTIQYACAMSWIHSGLRIDALIGHSLGEITAMAVSGILSLKDALDLVGARASLIKSHWGPSLGVMLLIETDVQTVLDIISTSVADIQHAEIACYNALASQVVVGSDESISRIEENMKCSVYRGIKHQRLNVTHGFHSQFTEPILEDLSKVAARIHFNPAKIPLEHCTLQHSAAVGPDHIVRHTKSPVFFYSAVRRIEQQFGPALWLEAGIDTPIVPMIKRAVSLPDAHTFQRIQSNFLEPSKALCEATIALWREGIPMSFWGFYESEMKQIWLPPYHFEKHRHWVTAQDHAYDLLEGENKNTLTETKRQTSEDSLNLIRASAKGNFHYSIDTRAARYVEIVSGHAVLSKPLCPASMFLECALNAVYMVFSGEDMKDWAISFENLKFESPLVLNHSIETFVILTGNDLNKTWFFQIKSGKGQNNEAPKTVHAEGKIGFSETKNIESHEKYAIDQMHEIRKDKTVQILDRENAYLLFSRVVDYSDILRGISSVLLSTDKAIATIDLPKTTDVVENLTGHNLMSVAVDNFLQVAGLLINSDSRCGKDNVFLATGAEEIYISPSYNHFKEQTLTVFAIITRFEGNIATCNIFVLFDARRLIVTIWGIHFTRVSVNNLETLLLHGNHNGTPNKIASDSNTTVSESIESTILSSEPEERHTSVESTISSPNSIGKTDETSSNPNTNAVKILVASYVGFADTNFPYQSTLAKLGVDSLAAIELADRISTLYGQSIASNELLAMTFNDLCLKLSANAPLPSPSPELGCPSVEMARSQPSLSRTETVCIEPRTEFNPIELLTKCDGHFDSTARKFGFTAFWTEIAPLQNELVISYIGEQFISLGVDLFRAQVSEILPQIKHLKKHTRLVYRLWDILVEHNIVARHGSKIIRSGKAMPIDSAETISRTLLSKYPSYSSEFRLLSITAPHLAEGLIGQTDHVQLLFGNPYGQACLKDFYINSPQFATMTEQLITIFEQLPVWWDRGLLKILEVGAGFGGTTTKLAEKLDTLGLSVEYTFTDASALLVSKAREDFGKLYPWMKFRLLDLENPPPASLEGSYDIILGTNVIHATTDTVVTCRRLKDLLRTNGFVILSEITRIINWYDLVYGQVKGWWSFDDGRNYPLQSAEAWARDLMDAGFDRVDYTKGSTDESTTQQLIIGSTRGNLKPINGKTMLLEKNRQLTYNVQTVPYKTINGKDILADIYLPCKPPTEMKIPIALMVHGGGFMTLSRKTVRPLQTQLLLDNGFLPISIDYRLCPEFNIIEGPMTDVRDSILWARTRLSALLRGSGFVPDVKRLVIIGWSTGGHLAMTTAWTCREIGQDPPEAILSFYAPTDLSSPALRSVSGRTAPILSESTDQTGKSMTFNPLEGLRSELLSHFFHQKDPDMGLRILLNGFSMQSSSTAPIAQHLIDRINPIAQAHSGTYTTPTYIIHAENDEIAPFSDAFTFIEILKKKRVRAKLLRIEKKGHLHDLKLRPGTEAWVNEVQPGYDFLFGVLGM